MEAYSDTLCYEEKKDIEYNVRNAYPMAKVTKFRGMSWTRELADCKQFVSYQTVIADYIYSEDVLSIDLHMFDCSNTTIRQFSMWLNANGYVPYTNVKKAAMHERKVIGSMYIPEPTGQVYIDNETGTHYTFDW